MLINSTKSLEKLPGMLVISFALMMALIIGARTDGPDYGGYFYYYENADDLYTYLYSLASNFQLKREHLEVTFFMLLSVAKEVGIPFGGFLFIISLIQLGLLLIIAKYTKNPTIFVFGYIALLMFYFNGWYIRQGLGILFGLLAWLKFKNKEKSSFFYLFLSLTSHSSLLILPLLIFFHGSLSKFGKVFVILIGLVFYFGNFSALNILRGYGGIYDLYFESDYLPPKVGVLHTLAIILYIFLLIKKSSSRIKPESISMTLFFCFIFVILYGNGIPLLGRMVEFILLVAVIFLLQDLNFLTKSYKSYAIYILNVAFCISYASNAFVFNEENLMQVQLLMNNGIF